MVTKALIFAALLSLQMCATAGGSFCDIAKPIRLSPAVITAMTDAEVNAALAHNAKGARMCGWVP